MFACPAFISVSVYVHLPADVSFFAESLLHRNAQLLPWQQWRIKKNTLGSFFVVVVAAFDLFFVIASNSNRCGEAVPLQRRSQLLRKNLTDRQTRSCDFIKHTHTHALSPVLSDVARPPLPAHFLSFVFPSIVGPCQHHQGNRSTALMPSPRLSVLQQLTDPHSVITNYR